jgi:hypothetical protein
VSMLEKITQRPEPKFLPIIAWPNPIGDERCITIRSDLILLVLPAANAEPRCHPYEWPYNGSREYAVQYELHGLLWWGVTSLDNLRDAGIPTPDIYSTMRCGSKHLPSSASKRTKH